jgi:putative transcriptional regulator
MAEQTYYESIMEGLQQAIDYEKGDKSLGRLRVSAVPDIEPIADFSKEKIKEIRQKTNLPQKYFAKLVGVSPRAVEAWETGKRKPTGSAKRLFQLIEKEPSIINAMIKY